MTPTEERLAITIDAILGFYSTGDAGRDRQSAAVIAKALLDELDIDHLLATHNIDAMLNAVHPRARVLHLSQVEVEQWYVEIGWTTSDYSSIPAVYTNHEVVGYGPTRTAAIADACRKAREDRP